MRHPFRQLLVKELRQSTPATLLTVGFVALWYLLMGYFRWKVLSGGDGDLVNYSLVLIGFLPFWALWRAYADWKSEWKGHHMHLLLSLPVPGWWLIISKLLALLLQMVVVGMALGVGALITFRGTSGMRFLTMIDGSVLVSWALIVLAGILILTFCLTAMVDFAQLSGRLVNRFGGVLSAIAFVTSGWALIRLAGLIAPLFRQFPAISIREFRLSGETVLYLQNHLHVLPSGFGALIAATLLIWLSSWLLENHLEA